MKIKTKQALLALLRKEYAYEGKEDIADVLAFCKAENIAIDEAKVKTLYSKAASISLDDNEVEEVPAAEPSATKALKDAGDALSETARIKRAESAEKVKAAVGASRVEAPAIRSHSSHLAKTYNIKAAAGMAGFNDADEMTAFNAAVRLRTYELFGTQYPSHFKGYLSGGFKNEDESVLMTKTASDTIGTAGGFLLANTLKSEVLWATEEWGVSRYIARNEIMVGNNTSFTRKTSIPSFLPLSSGAAQTGDIAYDLITLIPKVGAVLILTPLVLFEQSAVALGDTIAESIMEAYWNTVDECYFNGNGTSTVSSGISYFDQIGLAKGLTGTAGSTTSGSYFTASTNTMASWTGADYINAMARPNNFNTGRACWVMSRQAYMAGPLRIATQATTGMMPDTVLSPANTYMIPVQQRGAAPAGPKATLYGVPVFFSQRMSTATTTANTILGYYGDFITGSIIGHRTQLEIAQSTEYAFDKRALATRGFAEFAVNICGDGRASATQCGPITAIQTAS